MIIAILVGAVTGWLMSMPVGPVNTSAISRTLKYSFKIGLAVGAGAAIMDVIYCAGAAQINEFLIQSPVIKLVFEVVGFAALIFLGFRQLRSKLPDQEDRKGGDPEEHVPFHYHTKKEGQSLAESFMLGVLLYATNVMAVPEWIIVSGLWRSWGVLGTGFWTNVSFAVGAGAGTFGWFAVLIGWIARHHRGFRPGTLQKIRVGTGIVMLAFAGYFAYAIIFETQWQDVRSHVKSGTEKVMGMRMRDEKEGAMPAASTLSGNDMLRRARFSILTTGDYISWPIFHHPSNCWKKSFRSPSGGGSSFNRRRSTAA